MRVFSGQTWLLLASLLLLQSVATEAAAHACMGTDTSPEMCQAIMSSSQMVPIPSVSDGIRQDHGIVNVLFDNSICQFVDNNSSNDYFVPQASSTEFSAFLHNPPPGLTLGNCVLPTTYTATSTIPSATFQIFAEGGPVTPVGLADVAPLPGIAVPTNQSVMDGIMRVPASTTVTEMSQANPTPIQFFYTRQDCADDSFISPPPCNTWTIKEVQTLAFSAAPTSPVGTNSKWTPSVASTYFISANPLGPWTPITVDGIPGGTPGIYNNDYQPPVLQSCTYGGATYVDGQTWTENVASTQSPTSAECPSGAGTRVDDMSTPTTYVCNSGTANVQSTGTPTETGFTGACAAGSGFEGEITYYQLTPGTNPSGYDGEESYVGLLTAQGVIGTPTFFMTAEANIIPQVDNQPGFSVPGISQPETTWFGVCYDAGLEITTPGTYSFVVQADDGVALWIDGNLIFDDEDNLVSTTGLGTSIGEYGAGQIVNGSSVNLSSGLHDVEIEYYQAWAPYFGMQIWMLPPGQSFQAGVPNCSADNGTCPDPSSSYLMQLVGPPGNQTHCPGATRISSSSQPIYVVDSDNNRVEAFDTSGNYLFQFGSTGTGNGQFASTPWAVRVDQSGNLLVTDDANARVEKFDSNGNYLGVWGGFSQPDMAAQAPNGNVWVTDINGFNTNAGSVTAFNAAGTQLFKKGGFNGPAGVAFDARGNTWITSVLSNTIMKLDNNGNVLSQFGSSGSGNGQFNFPWAIAFDSSGRIWVADRNNNRIQVFDSTGGYLFQFGTAGSGNGQFNWPTDLAFDSNGNVWVTDMNNNRVEEFDNTGKFLLQFGTQGSGPGQLHVPIGITIGR